MGQSISSCGLKRRQADSAPEQNREKVNMPRNSVNIPGDTWLEALKFLTFSQWSQKCFVSRQINGIAQHNIFRLPKMVIDSAIMYHIYGRPNEELQTYLSRLTVVAFDAVMQTEQSTQWLKNRGFIFDAPVDILAENALIGSKEGKRKLTSNANVCILGNAQETIPLSEEEMHFPWFYHSQHRKPVLFYAPLNPYPNQYSPKLLAQFLNFVYHPTSYITEVRMFVVNQNYIDSLKCNIDSFDNAPRYIRCVTFSLIEELYGAETNPTLPDSLKWLARNVRAETIRLANIFMTDREANCVRLANFLLEPSGAKQCASNEMEIDVDDYPTAFLNTLIEKFYSIPLVEDAIPEITFRDPCKNIQQVHWGPNLIAQEVDSESADDLYIISNGNNRMRISFRWQRWYGCDCSVRVYSI